MSSAAAATPREFWPWLGHNSWRLQLGLFVIWIVSLFLPPMPKLVVLVVTIPAFLVLAVAEYRHDHKLCDACIANWPLDPQTEVDRGRRWLHMDHRWSDAPKLRLALMLGALAVMSLLLVALLFTTDTLWPSQLFNAGVYVVLALSAYARHVHKRLQPWCPWCHRDDGDDHFHPEPVTPPSVRADR